ncbi:MAG: hypothetical protein SXU28_07150 [Pseudomonadota bacterium]|nr:hypothetical protein [Pseudomonadota bacterium]
MAFPDALLAQQDEQEDAVKPVTRYTLRITPKERARIESEGRHVGETATASARVLQRRLETLRLAVGDISISDAGEITLDLSGADHNARLSDALVHKGRLEFRLVETGAADNTEILPVAGDLPPASVQTKVLMTGDAIRDAVPVVEPEWNGHVIVIRFDAEGQKEFGRISAANVGKQLAIVLDGTIMSMPIIQEPVLGGTVQISGNFTQEEANRLAISLASGALPADLEIVSQMVVR